MFRFFLILLAIYLMAPELEAQQMQWVPGDQVTDKSYADGTNCAENVLCYTLAYTPAEGGVLTSYTTNFLVDCDNGNSAVVTNRSLVMTDNSAQEYACEEIGMLLMHSSGNGGETTVKAGRTTFLHEICLQTSRKSTEINFSPYRESGMTTSIDKYGEPAITERPAYQPFRFKRNFAACANTPNSVFSTPEISDPGRLTDEEDGLQLSLSPNPTASQLQVQFTHRVLTADFRIMDATGKGLRSWVAPTGILQNIDVSQLPSGVYYLSAYATEEGVTEKFIIQK